jgi:uncharacterized protein (TIGR00725 family)
VTYIAVCGPGRASDEQAALAEEVGRRVAGSGAILVCGGLGGVMEAAARGATEAGGIAVGILPGTGREDANPHLAISVPTGMGEARNALVVRAADVLIAIAGEFGTLSEIALALKLGTPVVGLGTWELTKPGVPLRDPIIRAATPEQAVTLALDLAGP